MWGWLRYAYSLLLIVTAVTKVAAADQLLHSGGLLSTPLMIALAFTFELIAAGVISIAKPQLAFWFAIATFSAFTVIAGASWWLAADCNCFGPRTAAGLPLLVDLLCLFGLGVSYRSSQTLEATTLVWFRCSWRVATLLVIALAILLTGSVLTIAETTKRGATMPAWFGENLIGKQFPMLRDHRVAEVMMEDTTGILVFLRSDCEHCQQLVDHWQRESRELDTNSTIISVSMSPSSWIFMPGNLSAKVVHAPSTFEVRWDDEREPAVEAPTLIVIQNGKVVDVHTGDAVLVQLIQLSSRS